MKRLHFAVILPAILALVSGCVTFNDVDGTGNPGVTSVTTEGFTFTADAEAHFHVIGEPVAGFPCSLHGGCVDNGTVYIAEEGAYGAAPFIMEAEGGESFTLKSFQGAQMYIDDASADAGGEPNAEAILVEGAKTGGGTVSVTFDLPDTGFQTFNLPSGFNDLDSAIFSGADGGAIAVDNINYRPGSSVELPKEIPDFGDPIIVPAPGRR